MNPDKNSDLLERQLKILGQKIRIDILKNLNKYAKPISYSLLQKQVLGSNPSSVNFSFHLKVLKKNELVETSDEGYLLTSLGKKILGNIISMEQILNDQDKSIMIRTSKYSTEPFNLENIEKYLVREGEMEFFQAKQIAKEVSERLSRTEVEYLTTPLMREYINSILLENGLEDVRHRLTRLGTPPFEAKKLFNNNHLDPEMFIQELGSDVSEQFLLLNLLPKDLADLYLSGEIILLNLNYWSLRPLGAYINTKMLLDVISKESLAKIYDSNDPRKVFPLIQSFVTKLSNIHPFLSEDIVLGDFDFTLLSSLKDHGDSIFRFLVTELLKFSYQNRSYLNNGPALSLDFSFNNKEYTSEAQTFLDYLYKECQPNLIQISPLVLFEYSGLDLLNFNNNIFNNLNYNTLYYNKEESGLLNSTLIGIKKTNSFKNSLPNNIILDKILINLHKLAVNSDRNDDYFEEILCERVSNIFEFFEIKKDLLDKKLNSQKRWISICEIIFNTTPKNLMENSIKAISFIGLNEAIEFHCGIELDRIEISEKFALKILKIIKQMIIEKNKELGENYVLAQPHHLIDYSNNTHFDPSRKSKCYSNSIIRQETTLPINKQIDLFKKFQSILDGGNLFYLPNNQDDKNLLNSLKLLKTSKINATFKKEVKKLIR
ncbi:MAG: anaerobic ribonucleoside-triphosphate reductase [Promethearchaeota archaeon]